MARQRWERFHDALDRILVRAYPRTFREEFGEGLLADLRRLRRSTTGAGFRAGARLRLCTTLDVVKAGLRERFGRRRVNNGWTTTGGREMLDDGYAPENSTHLRCNEVQRSGGESLRV